MRTLATGYRRRAQCLSPNQTAAPGGRTMAAGCPTWFGVNVCTSEDVQAWAQALEEQEAAIDSILVSQAPGAADQARISAMAEQADIARTSGLGSPKSQVMAYARAVDLSHCVVSLWEGRGEVIEPKNKPKNGTKNGTKKGGTTAPAVPDTSKKPSGTTAILVAVGLAAGLVALVLRGGRG